MSALTKEQIEMLPMMIEEIRAVLPNAGEKTKPFIEILDDLFGTVIEQQAEIDRLRGELDWIGNHMVMSMALNKSDLIRAMKSRARAALEVTP